MAEKRTLTLYGVKYTYDPENKTWKSGRTNASPEMSKLLDTVLKKMTEGEKPAQEEVNKEVEVSAPQPVIATILPKPELETGSQRVRDTSTGSARARTTTSQGGTPTEQKSILQDLKDNIKEMWKDRENWFKKREVFEKREKLDKLEDLTDSERKRLADKGIAPSSENDFSYRKDGKPLSKDQILEELNADADERNAKPEPFYKQKIDQLKGNFKTNLKKRLREKMPYLRLFTNKLEPDPSEQGMSDANREGTAGPSESGMSTAVVTLLKSMDSSLKEMVNLLRGQKEEHKRDEQNEITQNELKNQMQEEKDLASLTPDSPPVTEYSRTTESAAEEAAEGKPKSFGETLREKGGSFLKKMFGGGEGAAAEGLAAEGAAVGVGEAAAGAGGGLLSGLASRSKMGRKIGSLLKGRTGTIAKNFTKGGLPNVVRGLVSKGTAETGVKTAEKAGVKVAEKAGAKAVGKGLLKAGGKSLLKKIPGIGLLAGLAFGVGRLMKGDIAGAIGEVASGAASTLPGVGTAASFAIDAGLAARDMAKEGEEGDAQKVTASAKGNAFGLHQTRMFKDGGVVEGPTAFEHSEGLGVMGEAGPEAVMPLQRGADGKLGIKSSMEKPALTDQTQILSTIQSKRNEGKGIASSVNAPVVVNNVTNNNNNGGGGGGFFAPTAGARNSLDLYYYA